MTDWHDLAVAAIREAIAGLPADAPIEERTKIVDAAYPFGERKYHPYKVWLQVRKEYLSRYQVRPDPSLAGLPLSPLERKMRKAGVA